MSARGGSQQLVEVRGLSKKFCRDLKRSLAYGVVDVMRELGGRETSAELRDKEFWALSDISFTLARGEALGIIGRNGAGKSTLLKLLTGLIKPNRGSISINGRLQALIELGAGFNPILTGRENIYINAAILGIPKQVIDKRLDEIIDFAELREFIDAPVNTYSSGMRVRLGFSVAINVRPEVLLIDEVLAVGDLRFRRKARNAMGELLNRNIGLIFISHNIHEVVGITHKTLWLEHGRVKQFGSSAEVCAEYQYEEEQQRTASNSVDQYNRLNKVTGEVSMIRATAEQSGLSFGRHVILEASESTIRVTITLSVNESFAQPIYHIFSLTLPGGEPVGYVALTEDESNGRQGMEIVRTFDFDMSPFHAGDYLLSYELGTEGGPRMEGIGNLIYIEVRPTAARLWRTRSSNSYHLNRMLDRGRGASMLPARQIELSARVISR